MLMNEAKEAAGLTKKAIEYYTEKGIVKPSVLENGYRDYNMEDIEVLKKIAMFRKLGIGLDDIRLILKAADSKEILRELAVRKELGMQKEKLQKEILEELAQGNSGEKIHFLLTELEFLEKNQSIAERLLELFPGYYGRYICLHFAAFLKEPIQTEKQKKAYNTILEFLDNMEMITLPEDLQEYLIENTSHIGIEQISEMNSRVQSAMEEPDEFLIENKEIIDWYLEYRQSEEYQNSLTCRLMEYMKQFHQTSGYYDIFIPAMKELSSSYAEYCEKMETANERMLGKYPEMEVLK